MGNARVAGILLACAVAAAAGDVERTARAVVDAHAAHDSASLARLAARDGTDPWLVADELVARGADDAAEAYVAAVPDARTRRDLARYLASPAARSDAGTRATLRAAHAKRLQNDPRATLVLLSLVEPDASVVGIGLAYERAAALRDLDRDGESVLALVAAARLADELGWHARRNFLLRSADKYDGVTKVRAAKLRERLDSGTAVVRYGLLARQFVAVVVTRHRSDILFLDAYLRDSEWFLHYSPTSPAHVVTDLRRRLIDPLGLDPAIDRLVISPPPGLPMIPSAGLDPERAIAFQRRPSLDIEPIEPGSGVLAVCDPGGVRRDEALCAGSVVLGPKVNLDQYEELGLADSRWRAVHLACPYDSDEQVLLIGAGASDRLKLSRLAVYSPERARDRKNALWFNAELLVVSGDGAHRMWNDRAPRRAARDALDIEAEWTRRPYWCPEVMRRVIRQAPHVLVPCWQPDSDATRALMVRFYALWDPGDGEFGLPAAEALRRAQAYVRSHERWRHPYYWAGWQLWGRID